MKPETYKDRDVALAALGFSSYAGYLASPLWKKIRAKVFSAAKKRCRLCGGKAGQIHHLSYAVPVLEGNDLSKLAAVCDPCHRAVELDRERKRSMNEAGVIFARLLKQSPNWKESKQAKRRRKIERKRLRKKPPAYIDESQRKSDLARLADISRRRALAVKPVSEDRAKRMARKESRSELCRKQVALRVQ